MGLGNQSYVVLWKFVRFYWLWAINTRELLGPGDWPQLCGPSLINFTQGGLHRAKTTKLGIGIPFDVNGVCCDWKKSKWQFLSIIDGGINGFYPTLTFFLRAPPGIRITMLYAVL